MQQIEKFQKDGYLSLLMLFACVHSDVFKTNVLKFFLNWNQSDAFKTANWIPILDWKVFLLNPDRDYIWMLNRFCSYGVFLPSTLTSITFGWTKNSEENCQNSDTNCKRNGFQFDFEVQEKCKQLFTKGWGENKEILTWIVKEIQLDRNMCDPNSYCFLPIEFSIQEKLKMWKTFNKEKYLSKFTKISLLFKKWL